MTERTGVLAFWKNYDRKLYLKAAILADELGYDSFWIPEAWGYEIFSLLTEMAIHTKRIKLGTGIVNVFSRSPSLIAMNAATVDEISDGRLILGIGTSGKRVIEGFHGRAFDKPLSQWKDGVKGTRTLLSGRKVTEADATAAARKPTLVRLFAQYPNVRLRAHGTAVGMPSDEDMGNSEVGHNAIGAGQVYAQGAALGADAIAAGSTARLRRSGATCS